MATLDNFFAKLSRPPVSAHNVSEDAASGATCFEPKIISVEGRFHDHCDNEEKRPSKRIRHGGSASDRLKTRKKQKVGGDLKERNENENFKQDETINVDGELQTVDDETSEDCAETVNRHSLNEISYEDFLAANEASSKENKQTPIKKENQDDIVTQAEICDTVAHVNDGQTSNPDGTEKLANVSSNEGKDDLSSGVPPSSVASKDIRSFFGKTTANAASQNRPKSCATKMKVKAEVHVEPSVHATVTNNKPSADANRHMDLARWQRANIVITNADLDIEIIDVCNTSFDAKTAEENTEVVLVDEPMTIDEKMILPRPLAVSGPVVANLQQTSSAKLPEMPALETGSYTSSESVNVVDLTKCGRKTRQKNSTNIISKKCDENKLPAHSIDLSIDESEGSNCHIQKEIAIAENSCAKTVITEDLDCKLEVKAAVDSSCDQTAKKNLQRYLC
jgi:hypothetical protein